MQMPRAQEERTGTNPGATSSPLGKSLLAPIDAEYRAAYERMKLPRSGISLDINRVVDGLVSDNLYARFDSAIDALRILTKHHLLDAEVAARVAVMAAGGVLNSGGQGVAGVASFGRANFVKINQLTVAKWQDVLNSRTYKPPISARDVQMDVPHDGESLWIYFSSIEATAAWAREVELMSARHDSYHVSDAFYKGFRAYLREHCLAFAQNSPWPLFDLINGLAPEYRCDLFDHYLENLPDSGLAIAKQDRVSVYMEFFKCLVLRGEDWFPPRNHVRDAGGDGVRREISRHELAKDFIDTVETLHKRHSARYLPQDCRSLRATIDLCLDRFLNPGDPVSPLRQFTLQFDNPELDSPVLTGRFGRSMTRLILGLHDRKSLSFEEAATLIDRIKNIATAVLEPEGDGISSDPAARVVGALLVSFDDGSEWLHPTYTLAWEGATAWREAAQWAWMILGQEYPIMDSILAMPASDLFNTNHFSTRLTDAETS